MESFLPTVLVTDAVGVAAAHLVRPAVLLHWHHLLQPCLQGLGGGGAGLGWALQALELAQVLDLHSRGGLAAGGTIAGGSFGPREPITGGPAVFKRLEHLMPPFSIGRGLRGSSGWSDQPVVEVLLHVG